MKINQNDCAVLYSRHTYSISNINKEKQTQSDEQQDTPAARSDSIEISRQGLDFCSGDKKITVSSGCDTLEAEMRSDKNVRVYFSSTAIVSRTIKRGFIDVDGKKIILSDDVKEKLTKIDKQAQTAREAAFALYNINHNMAVAKQQSDVMNKKMKSDIQAFKIAAKMSKGSQVSHEEESELLKYDPEMYFMAKIAQQMAKHKDKDYDKIEDDEPSQSEGIDTGESFTTYRTKMDIDMSTGTVDASSIDLDEKEVNI